MEESGRRAKRKIVAYSVHSRQNIGKITKFNLPVRRRGRKLLEIFTKSRSRTTLSRGVLHKTQNILTPASNFLHKMKER